ncbi:hypothetical protein BDR25DRAFT_359594 [Lindgomyces ingoldianus]|uniref:Uncharacterized protein n=1 Tax=Lindgomyces ingoldianus TaxID=673940 RepID=A0ACB6QIS6_9PLEO|nr:hypothetical protein BDR25DRAFT_359594 [Lindgomyces ingoldianus]
MSPASKIRDSHYTNRPNTDVCVSWLRFAPRVYGPIHISLFHARRPSALVTGRFGPCARSHSDAKTILAAKGRWLGIPEDFIQPRIFSFNEVASGGELEPGIVISKEFVQLPIYFVPPLRLHPVVTPRSLYHRPFSGQLYHFLDQLQHVQLADFLMWSDHRGHPVFLPLLSTNFQTVPYTNSCGAKSCTLFTEIKNILYMSIYSSVMNDGNVTFLSARNHASSFAVNNGEGLEGWFTSSEEESRLKKRMYAKFSNPRVPVNTFAAEISNGFPGGKNSINRNLSARTLIFKIMAYGAVSLLLSSRNPKARWCLPSGLSTHNQEFGAMIPQLVEEKCNIWWRKSGKYEGKPPKRNTSLWIGWCLACKGARSCAVVKTLVRCKIEPAEVLQQFIVCRNIFELLGNTVFCRTATLRNTPALSAMRVSKSLTLPELPHNLDDPDEREQFEQVVLLRRPKLDALRPLTYDFSPLRRKLFEPRVIPEKAAINIASSKSSTNDDARPACPITFSEDEVTSSLSISTTTLLGKTLTLGGYSIEYGASPFSSNALVCFSAALYYDAVAESNEPFPLVPLTSFSRSILAIHPHPDELRVLEEFDDRHGNWAPSLESKPNSTLPDEAMVIQYLTIES